MNAKPQKRWLLEERALGVLGSPSFAARPFADTGVPTTPNAHKAAQFKSRDDARQSLNDLTRRERQRFRVTQHLISEDGVRRVGWSRIAAGIRRDWKTAVTGALMGAATALAGIGIILALFYAFTR